jgi:hypothetical protein
MAALAAKLQPSEMRNYFERIKMSVMNAIRNKLIKPIFAVVQRNQPLPKNYHYGLV